jgi:hypothetical protein
MVADQQFPEVGVAKDCSKACTALLEDLFSVRNEQQTRSFALGQSLCAKAAVIERSNYSFACASSCHDEVSPPVMVGSVSFQLIEDFLLVGIWPHLEKE